MEHLERIAAVLAAGPLGYFFGGPGFAVHAARAAREQTAEQEASSRHVHAHARREPLTPAAAALDHVPVRASG
jgi:hypothetical protein